jgi:hypothetical protein
MRKENVMDPAGPHLNPYHFLAFMLPFFFVMIVIVFIPYWFIFKKAGFTPWLSLLMFVPLGNIIMLYVLAFSTWKVVPAPIAQYPGYSPTPPNR